MRRASALHSYINRWRPTRRIDFMVGFSWLSVTKTFIGSGHSRRWSTSSTAWFSPRFSGRRIPEFRDQDPIVTAISHAIQDSQTLGSPSSSTYVVHLKKILPKLKPFHVTSLILSNPLSLPASSILHFFEWVSSLPGFRLTLHSYCYMAHFLCAAAARRRSMAEEARRLLRFIVSRKGKGSVDSFLKVIIDTKGIGSQPPDLLFDLLLDVYVGFDFISDAVHCVRLLGKFGYQLPFHSCRRLLGVLLKSGPGGEFSVSVSWDFYLEILDYGFPVNIQMMNKFMSCFCKDGRVGEAHLVFNEIGRRGLFHTVVSYNTLMDGYCKCGNMMMGLCLKQNMLKRGILPDVFTYSVFINALCKEGRINEADNMYEKMCVGGLLPNTVILTTLIHGHCKAGKTERVMGIYNDMLEKGLNPDVITYNSIVDCFSRVGDMNEARKFINEMKCRGIAPDQVTYTSLLDGYCKDGDIPAAFEVKHVMAREGIQLDDVAYTALITGLARDSQVSEAECLLKEMIRLGFRPDDAIYTLVIYEHCKKGDVKRGFKLFKEMRAQGFAPNVETYNVVLTGFCKLGQMKNAQMFLDAMLDVGVKPDDVTYNILLEGHQRSGRAVDIEKIRSEKCLISDFAAYTYLIREATKKRKNEGMKDR